jgi:hypothetical protein
MTGDPDRRSNAVLLGVGGAILFLFACVALITLTAGIPSRVGPAASSDPVFAARIRGAVPTTASSPSPSPTPSVSDRLAATHPAAATTRPSSPIAAKKAKPPAASGSSAKPTPAKPVTGYRLTNVATGKCVGLQAKVLVQVNCADGLRLRAEPTRVVSGMISSVQLYWLRDQAGPQMCLDLPNAGAEPSGTAVLEYQCVEPSSADNQEWRLQDLGHTTRGHPEYALVNQASGNCLDVSGTASRGTDLAVGLALKVYSCRTGSGDLDDHRWIFE